MLKFYQYTLKKHTDVTDDLYILDFDVVPGEEPLPEFIPGQWVSFAIYNEDGSIWLRRPFSIASSPTDTDKLQLAIRVHADFTTKAQSIEEGLQVGFAGPFGRFVFDAKNKKMKEIVLLAGGIGIAPYLSILRYIKEKRLKTKVTLLYSNKTEKEITYKEEIENLKKDVDLTTHYTLTREEPSDWDGETGRIDEKMIEKHCESLKKKTFFLCGSSDFIHSLKKKLLDMGVSEEYITKELFF